MTTVTTRAVKGTPLTHSELDGNFNNLNTDKLERSSNLSDVQNKPAALGNIGAVPLVLLGAANGVATLDSASKVPLAQLSGVVLSSVVGVAGGVAALDGGVKVPVAQIPTLPYLPAGGGSLTGAVELAAEVSVASAASVNLGAQTSNNVLITGVVTVTSFGTAAAGKTRQVRMESALILTHNATSLVLPGAANIATAAGDCFEAISLGSGNWIVRQYQKADGKSLIVSLSVPTGMMAHFLMTSAPTGWLKANGAAISRTTYAALFSTIGTTFGVGDGSTTFNVPDLRGEFVRGLDDGRGVDSGRTLGSFQASSFASHTHPFSTWEAGTWSPPVGAPILSIGGAIEWPNSVGIGATGGTDTKPRNIALLACVKF